MDSLIRAPLFDLPRADTRTGVYTQTGIPPPPPFSMGFTPKVNVPIHPIKPAWIVPKDELVDFTHIDKIPFYPKCKLLLESEFHRTHFLPRQVACINCAIQGYDLLIALPTSAGKSLCYQLPAVFNTSTITLVVSPTKTLIEDQISALHALGPQWKTMAQRSHSDHYTRLRATFDDRQTTNSSPGPRLFYICPEWLDKPENKRTLYSLCGQDRIARIVVDEAHNAIRGLANEHRPAYRSIFDLRTYFPTIPFTLVSASLTHAHQTTLTTALMARGQFLSVSAPSRRTNFVYRVVHIRGGPGSGRSGQGNNRWTGRFNSRVGFTGRNDRNERNRNGDWSRHGQQTLKIATIATYLSNRPTARGFVFVPTRKLAQVVAEKLGEMLTLTETQAARTLQTGDHDGIEMGEGVGVEWYHAGEHARLPDIMARFNAGRIPVLVCTSAFGEGVDNKLVDFVFHYSIPPSMTRYFQETGRIGRDGQQAECILLYSFSDIRSILNVVAHDIPSTNSRNNRKDRDRAFLPSQQAELQEVLEFCTDSFSCRHKRMFELFKSPLPITPTSNPAPASAPARFAALYARAMYDAFPTDLVGEDDAGVDQGVDEDCGGCDVCERRYRPFADADHEDVTAEEPDNFQLISNAEIETVENAFRNDTAVLVSELVRRVSSPGNTTMKGERAREVVEFLAVAGVLKMTFDYVRSGKGAGFSIKLEKGSNKIDEIHRPLPIPYTALGPLKLPTRSRKPAKPNPKKEKRRQRARTEESIIDLTSDVNGEDGNEEWNPSGNSSDSEDDEDSENAEADSDSESETSWTEIDDDDDASMATISDDGDDVRAILLDGTEEDGYGMRVTPRPKSSRKRRRSPSFELPSPMPSSTHHDQEPDSEPSASPPKRRRTEAARRDQSIERPTTDSARMLEKYYKAATAAKRRGRDCSELFQVEKETLRRLFARHDRIVDEAGFRLALKEVKASKDDATILLEWYEWIEHEVFTRRYIVAARRD